MSGLFQLSAFGWDLCASPAMGGSLLSLKYQGRNILRDGVSAAHVLDSAAYPLFPFAGRVHNAQFGWQGEQITLARNFPPEPHAIHGTAWQQAWAVTAQSNNGFSMEYEDAGTDWPWPFHAQQSFMFDGNRLNASLALTNISARPMPAGIGWHPFFDAVQTSVQAQNLLQWNNADTQPCTTAITAALNKPVSTDALDLDHMFRWPARTARLTGKQGSTTIISASDALQQLVVYTPRAANFICLEPLSHVPGALNSALPHDQTGLQILSPQQTMRAEIQITIED